MSAEYPAATWAPIPGFGFPMGSHGGNTPLFIILHGTASGDGTAQQQVAFFQGDNQHGVHFVIGKDGAVYQMVQLADAAYGNCCVDPAPAHAAFWDTILQRFSNLNTCTISIEHCKIASDNSDILTPAQQDASFKLVAWLCKTLNIPARDADVNGGITGHFSINGINRANCPGPYPWTALFNFLEGGVMPGVPQGWSDDGATLTAPNGQTVTGAFRAYIIEQGWDPSDYPLEAQEHVTPLEVGNTALGAGLRQTFRKSRLEWTDAQATNLTGVLVCWLGQEALALEKALAVVPPPTPQPSKWDLAGAAIEAALKP